MSIKSPYTLLITQYYKLISYDKIRFIIVGGTGFVVNFLSLVLFFDALNLPILFAQIISAELAMLATFIGNNFWAFTDHHHTPIYKKFLTFHASAIMGIAINSTCVVLLVHFGHVFYGFALMVGSIAGLAWNYTMYKHFVFKKPKRIVANEGGEAK